MSNLELHERFVSATGRRDVDDLEQLIAADAVFDYSRSRGPYHGVYRGEAEIRQLLENVIEAWESLRFETLSTYEMGAWLAAEMSVTFRGRGSGVELKARGARVYELRDGKIARFVQFQDMESAREYVDAQ